MMSGLRRRAVAPGENETIHLVTDHNHLSAEPGRDRTSRSEENGMWRHLEDQAPAAEEPTPQLTTSQVKRLATPMMGMVITMVVLVSILAVLWFMNPEPDVTYTRDEDVAEAASWADSVTDYSPIAPEVPDEWSANYARWETRPDYGVEVWEAGYTTEAVRFVGFAQTDNPNPAWVNAETNQAPATGTTTIDGLEFETRQDDDRRFYVLEAEDNDRDGSTVVIGGDAAESEYSTALEAIVESIGRDVPPNDDAEEPADD